MVAIPLDFCCVALNGEMSNRENLYLRCVLHERNALWCVLWSGCRIHIIVNCEGIESILLCIVWVWNPYYCEDPYYGSPNRFSDRRRIVNFSRSLIYWMVFRHSAELFCRQRKFSLNIRFGSVFIGFFLQFSSVFFWLVTLKLWAPFHHPRFLDSLKSFSLQLEIEHTKFVSQTPDSCMSLKFKALPLRSKREVSYFESEVQILNKRSYPLLPV